MLSIDDGVSKNWSTKNKTVTLPNPCSQVLFKKAKRQSSKTSNLNSDFRNMELSDYARDSLPVLQQEDYSAIPNNYFTSLPRSFPPNVFELFDINYTAPLFVIIAVTNNSLTVGNFHLVKVVKMFTKHNNDVINISSVGSLRIKLCFDLLTNSIGLLLVD